MFCVRCGNRISDDARFCNSCGAPVSAPGRDDGAARGAGARTPDLKGFVNNARETFNKNADLNNDGRVDPADASAAARQISDSVREGSGAIRERIDGLRKDTELKTLRPVFREDLKEGTDFYLPKLIRVSEADDRHKRSPLCRGSVGHETEKQGLRFLTVYPNTIGAFDLDFYPNAGHELYYSDPFVQGRYLELNNYFNLLRKARVSELERISQSLGATYFKVSLVYSSSQKASSSGGVRVGVGLPPLPFADLKTDVGVRSEADVRGEADQTVFSESVFTGHAPVRPELVYFRNDPDIENLIHLRLSDNPVKHREYHLAVGRSSGLAAKEAQKIKVALLQIGCSVNSDLVKNAENEERLTLYYKVDF